MAFLKELNEISKPFELYVESKLVKITDLQINNSYLIAKVFRCKQNKFGAVPVFVKFSETNCGTFLPQRIADKITNEQIKQINEDKRVCLIYKGLTENTYFGKSLALIEFDRKKEA